MLRATSRRLLDAGAVAASFLATSATVWALSGKVVSLSGTTRQSIPLDIIDALRTWQQQLREDRLHERIAFLGDSMLASTPGEPSIPSAAEKALHQRDGRGGLYPAVHTLWVPAWNPVTEYFLADEIIREHPARIVLELNLRTLGPVPLEPFGYPQLSGWIAPSRLPEAVLLPLSEAGLTVDRLLFYELLVGAGLDGLWKTVVDRQARLYNVRTPLELSLDRLLSRGEALTRHLGAAFVGMQSGIIAGGKRLNAERLGKIFGNVLSGIDGRQPRIRVLLAMVDRFRSAGIPVLVWVAPVNLEHVRSVGLPTTPFARATATLGRELTAHGAEFFDFHSGLPDTAFRDHGDHLMSTGTPAATEFVGMLIAEAIARTAPAHSEHRETPAVSGRTGDAVQ